MADRHAPGTPVDVRYDNGYDVVYLHGHVEPEEAARLAAEFVRDARLDADGLPWWGRDRDAPFVCVRCGHSDDGRPSDVLGCEDLRLPAGKCLGCGAEWGEDEPLPRYGRAKHRHGRWIFADESLRSEGYTRMLNEHADPGRGAFKMTAVFDLDEIERDEARERLRREKVDRLVAEVRARYPEAEITRAASFGIDDAHVVFALPGLTGKVDADSRTWPATVGITESDRAAWERLYRGRVLPEAVARG